MTSPYRPSKNKINTKLKNLLIDIPSPSVALIIEFIEKHKKEIDWKSGDFLSFAVYLNEAYSPALVEYLLKQELYGPNHISHTGHSPLDFISEQLESENFLKIAKIVISFGGDVNALDIRAKPIILKALNTNFSNYVLALAHSGANCNAVYEEQTLLYYAIQCLPFSYLSAEHLKASSQSQIGPSNNNIKIIQTLLDFGAKTVDAETNFNALDLIEELNNDMLSFSDKTLTPFQEAKEMIIAHEEKLKLEASVPPSSNETISSPSIKI